MHIRRPPSGDGPKIYRPNESVASRREPPARPVAHEPDSIPRRRGIRLSAKVNRRRGTILTMMVSIAAIASFGSVVWWAHNQDVRAGGKGLEPLVVQAPATPTRVKPENAGGLVPPDQDKEVYNRMPPGRCRSSPRSCCRGRRRPGCRRAASADAGRAQGAGGPPRPRRPCRPARRRPPDAGTAGQPADRDAGAVVDSRQRERPEHRQPDRGHVRRDRRLAHPDRLGEERGHRQVDLGASAGGARRRARQPAHAGRARSISATRACGTASRPARSTRSRRTASAARSRRARPTASPSRRHGDDLVVRPAKDAQASERMHDCGDRRR